MQTGISPGAGTLFEPAPAKINLALHVTGQRADGYHLLETLVTFTDAGDRLSFTAADSDSFSLSGRFAPLLSQGSGPDDNLVLRARDLLRDAVTDSGAATFPVAIHLEKNLPVASGIGGGSADAAAALRGLLRLWNVEIARDRLDAIALKLGADVPMCLESQPLLARGIGEELSLLPGLPALPLVLANPLTGVSTPEIFRRLTNKDNPAIGAVDGIEDWLALIAGLRNDLEPPALALLPAIAEISALLSQQGARLVRMSGSGATCFGVFASIEDAQAAETALRKSYPDWYFQATATQQGSGR